MDFTLWSILDTAILLAQLGYIVYRHRFYKKLVGTKVACLFAIGVWLFITSIGLATVGLKSINGADVALPRCWVWHLKINGLIGLNDLIVVATVGLAISVWRQARDWGIATTALKGFVVLIAWGIAAMSLAPYGPDLKTLLTALRPLLLIFVGWIAGAAAAEQREVREWLPALLTDLCIQTLVGAVSMMLLSSEFRNDRYWISAFLQSQIANDVAISLLLIPMLPGVGKRARWLALCTAVLCTFGGYKVNFFFLPALAGVYLIGNLVQGSRAAATKSYTAVVVVFTALLAVGLVAPFLVTFYLAENGMQDDAIGTRYYQVVNVMQTLYQSGPVALCFGIGWNQWYSIIEKFPFIDLGAWTVDQMENPIAKFSVQLVPFSLIRSGGLFGLTAVFAMIVKCGSQAIWNAIQSRRDLVRIFCLVLFHSLQLLCLPSLLPEGAFLNALVLAAFCGVSFKRSTTPEKTPPAQRFRRPRAVGRTRRPLSSRAISKP